MRNAVACVKGWRFALVRRVYTQLSTATVRNRTQDDTRKGNEATRSFANSLLHAHDFSTGFASVHGERASSEYAKLRRESLETEFRQLLGKFGSESISAHHFRPFLAPYRAAIISFHVVKLTIWHFFVRDLHKRAVKLGQALSTRPDILPSAYCQELAKLQDQIPPFSTRVACKSIESQLGAPISQIFSDISPEPVAAASLGQVYKAHLSSGELGAVKVQRPGMSLALTLDALLFHMIGGQLKRFTMARRDLLVAVNEMLRHMFEEIDYIVEAQNADRFAALYACPPNKSHLQWLIQFFVHHFLKGVYCSLRQMLEEGFFHADPHPGNLVATSDGSLAYFDFGMMGDLPQHYRVGLVQMIHSLRLHKPRSFHELDISCNDMMV